MRDLKMRCRNLIGHMGWQSLVGAGVEKLPRSRLARTSAHRGSAWRIAEDRLAGTQAQGVDAAAVYSGCAGTAAVGRQERQMAAGSCYLPTVEVAAGAPAAAAAAAVEGIGLLVVHWLQSCLAPEGEPACSASALRHLSCCHLLGTAAAAQVLGLASTAAYTAGSCYHLPAETLVLLQAPEAKEGRHLAGVAVQAASHQAAVVAACRTHLSYAVRLTLQLDQIKVPVTQASTVK